MSPAPSARQVPGVHDAVGGPHGQGPPPGQFAHRVVDDAVERAAPGERVRTGLGRRGERRDRVVAERVGVPLGQELRTGGTADEADVVEVATRHVVGQLPDVPLGARRRRAPAAGWHRAQVVFETLGRAAEPVEDVVEGVGHAAESARRAKPGPAEIGHGVRWTNRPGRVGGNAPGTALRRTSTASRCPQDVAAAPGVTPAATRSTTSAARPGRRALLRQAPGR